MYNRPFPRVAPVPNGVLAARPTQQPPCRFPCRLAANPGGHGESWQRPLRDCDAARAPFPHPAAPDTMSGVPANCVVTGGSGFVGQRLVEMLVERGVRASARTAPHRCPPGAAAPLSAVESLSLQAKRVVSFDIAPKPTLWGASDDPRIEYMQAWRAIAQRSRRTLSGVTSPGPAAHEAEDSSPARHRAT